MMKKIGFIDYYLDEWHAVNYPAWIKEAAQRLGLAYAIDYAWAECEHSPVTGGSTAEWCARYGVKACGSMEELCGSSDAIVILSPDHAENHLRYARTALRYGKPVYIDKTFAPTLTEAKEIFSIAGRFGTPVCSSSALRFAGELETDKPVRELVTTGCGFSFDTYAVHQVEMIVYCLGTGATRLMALQNGSDKTLVIDYADCRRALLCQSIGAEAPFTVSMDCGGPQAVYRPIISDYFGRMIGEMLHFFETGEPMAPQAQTLEVMAILDAGRQALCAPDIWVPVAH